MPEEMIAERNAAYEKRREAARAEYPLKRHPDESMEQHKARVQAIIKVLYGDTDSVMIRVADYSLKDALALGKTYAAWITKWFFKQPMELAFGKILLCIESLPVSYSLAHCKEILQLHPSFAHVAALTTRVTVAYYVSFVVVLSVNSIWIVLRCSFSAVCARSEKEPFRIVVSDVPEFVGVFAVCFVE
jgi:hypothetical protein